MSCNSTGPARRLSRALARFAYLMKVYSHSEPGGHLTNEDAVAVVRYAEEPPILLCVLSDGQGGQAGGARASQLAVDSCLEQAQSYRPNKLLNPFTWQAIGEAVDRGVSLDPAAGYATFVGLAVLPPFAAGVSCGDSAVALLLSDKFVQLTERQHKNPPVGSGAARLTPMSAKLEGSWKLLVMSDGVWKFAGWEAVAERCRTEVGEALISSLRELAVSNTSGRLLDDFSVILIEA